MKEILQKIIENGCAEDFADYFFESEDHQEIIFQIMLNEFNPITMNRVEKRAKLCGMISDSAVKYAEFKYNKMDSEEASLLY